MGAMLLASALNRNIPPGISSRALPHAQRRTPYGISYLPVSFCILHFLP